MSIYMAVTADEYELPIDFSSNLKKLAERTGVSASNISCCISRKCNGKVRGFKFVKVEVENE